MSERPPRRLLSLPLRLLLLLAGAAVVLAVTVAAQLAAQDRLADRRDDVLDRIDPAIAATADLRAAALDQEAGVHGYALTGDRSFVARYQAARTAGDAALDDLDRLLADTPALADEAVAVRGALGDWRDTTAEPTIDAGPRPGPAAAALAAGDERFDAARDRIDALADGLDAVHDARRGHVDPAYTTVLTIIAVQAASMVVVGVVLALALSRLVLRPLSRLREDARMVAAGDLTRPVRGGGPPELVHLGTDVEAMRARIVEELERLGAIRADLERRTAELERSNADLEQFAYVASHDLQEPLRKVSGFCQLLEKRYGDHLDERGREYIRFAVDGAKRMQVLINGLLAFSRVGRTTEEFEPVDMDELAAGAVELLGESIEAGGATVTIGPLPEVTGDPRLLAVVLQNLLANALKFHGDDAPAIDVRAERLGDEWAMTVSDNGIGIDPRYSEQIFTIFKRLHTRTEYEGTGIGLAVCKKIVEFHGGRIWLEPAAGPGAAFTFTLPVHPDPATPAHAGRQTHDVD